MAKKKETIKKLTKLELAEGQLSELRASVRKYVAENKYRTARGFQIELQAKTQDGKDGLFNVPSLIASVLTAQGLGQEVRLVAEGNAKGGTLYVRFYDKVPTTGLEYL